MLDPVHHAKSYPFPAPDHSYLYENGAWRRLDDVFDTAGRVPVLAAGSNQSPEQLARKYGHIPDIGPIPAQRGRLHNFDVVYAAHLARYGSVPATFQHSPGTIVIVFVLWLTELQLARMHETEGNYSYDHLYDVRIKLDSGRDLTEAYGYTSNVGCLNHDGGCIGIAEIEAENRRFQPMRQPEVLALIRDRLEPHMALDQFIEQQASELSITRDRSVRLGEGALAVTYRRRTVSDL